jgi:hypothetical protein
MGARVVVTFQGIEETISRLTQIEEKAGQNLIKQMNAVSDDGKTAWKQGTPEGKTKRLRGEENATPSGLSITFTSPTRYYRWVDEGHDTPKGWRRRTKHGIVYREAKRRSHVKGREMTQKLVDWLRQNMTRYLSKFLDNV